MSTKTLRKAKRGPRTSTKCQGCGKPIAEQLLAEALCCKCRYGGMRKGDWDTDDYELHIYHN